jgi:hypothetical protein
MRTVVFFVSEVAQLTHVLSFYKEMSRLTELTVRIRVLRLVHVRTADAATEHRTLLVPGKVLAFVDPIHVQVRTDDCRILAARRRHGKWNTVLEVDHRERLVSIAIYPVQPWDGMCSRCGFAPLRVATSLLLATLRPSTWPTTSMTGMSINCFA